MERRLSKKEEKETRNKTKKEAKRIKKAANAAADDEYCLVDEDSVKLLSPL
jgi:hypothetical protein